MTEEPVIDMGFLSLPPIVVICRDCGQPVSEACETHRRTRIEIVADELGVTPKVDYEADMAYIKLRKGKHHRCDVKLEDRSLITDYDEAGNLLGIEIFMVRAAIRQETIEALKRLLAAAGRSETASP